MSFRFTQILAICTLTLTSVSYSKPTLDDLSRNLIILQARIDNLENTFSKGSIIFMEATTCPSGWSKFEKANGRYLVASTTSSSVGKVIGKALSDTENRATGGHSHGVNDPGHSHTFGPLFANSALSDNNMPSRGSHNPISGYAKTSAAKTGIAIASVGVAGTNAPYIQLLVCQKS